MDDEAGFYQLPQTRPKSAAQGLSCAPQCRTLMLVTILIELIVLPIWLTTVTVSAATARNEAQQAMTAAASGGGGSLGSLTLPLCDGCAAYSGGSSETTMIGSAVSFEPSQPGTLRVGAGTSAYVGAQRISSPGLIPQHTGLVAIANDSVVLGLGSVLMVGFVPQGGDWVTGQTVTAASSSSHVHLNDGSSAAGDGAAAVAWSQLVDIPLYPDDIMPLDATNRLIVVVGGGKAVVGAVASQADPNRLTQPVTWGAVTAFYDGTSVDTDTAVLSGTSFAVSYYTMDASYNVYLSTVYGSVDPGTHAITFGAPAVYSANHMTHGIVALTPSVWVLAYPNDNLTSPSGNDPVVESDGGVPIGLVVASVTGTGSGASITLWGTDGASSVGAFPSPWVQKLVRGYYFFDLVTLDVMPQPVLGGIATTIALAVPDAAVGYALRVMTAQLWLGTDGAGALTSVDVLWGDLLTATPAGASEGYKYFSVQPLFTLPQLAAARPAELSTGTGASTLRSSLSNGKASNRAIRANHTLFSAAASSGSLRDFALVYSDVSAGGSVQATIVSYDVGTQALSVAVPEMPLAPSFPELDPTGSSDYYWVGASTVPLPADSSASLGGVASLSQILVLSSLKAPGETSGMGNITLVERRAKPLGVATSASVTAPSVNVAASGVVTVPTSAILNGTVGSGASSSLIPAGAAIVATTRGQLIAAVDDVISAPARLSSGASATAVYAAPLGPVQVTASVASGCLGTAAAASAPSGSSSGVGLLLGPALCTQL